MTIKYALKSNIYNILIKKYSPNTRPLYINFKKTIYKEGFDLLGNTIEYNEYENTYLVAKSISNPIQKIELELITSHNNKFKTFIIPDV